MRKLVLSAIIAILCFGRAGARRVAGHDGLPRGCIIRRVWRSCRMARFLIAEAGGHGERSAGISLLRPDGQLGRLVSGIPSTFSKDNLPSAPALAVSPDGASILVALAGGAALPPPERSGRLAAGDAAQPRGSQSAGKRIQRRLPAASIRHRFQRKRRASGDGCGRERRLGALEGEDGSLFYLHRFAALDNPHRCRRPAGTRCRPVSRGAAPPCL